MSDLLLLVTRSFNSRGVAAHPDLSYWGPPGYPVTQGSETWTTLSDSGNLDEVTGDPAHTPQMRMVVMARFIEDGDPAVYDFDMYDGATLLTAPNYPQVYALMVRFKGVTGLGDAAEGSYARTIYPTDPPDDASSFDIGAIDTAVPSTTVGVGGLNDVFTQTSSRIDDFGGFSNVIAEQLDGIHVGPRILVVGKPGDGSSTGTVTVSLHEVDLCAGMTVNLQGAVTACGFTLGGSLGGVGDIGGGIDEPGGPVEIALPDPCPITALYGWGELTGGGSGGAW